MRKLGLIGGLSWASTVRYYTIINEAVQDAKGGVHSAPLLIDSLDFAEVARCTSEDDWNCAADHLIASAQRLETGGAGGDPDLRQFHAQGV